MDRADETRLHEELAAIYKKSRDTIDDWECRSASWDQKMLELRLYIAETERILDAWPMVVRVEPSDESISGPSK